MQSLMVTPGIDALLKSSGSLLSGRRVGLVAHPASVDRDGVHSAERLQREADLVALFAPEHGLYGEGGAGEELASSRHPFWDIPVHSLYGEHRKPSAESLDDIDVLVIDLQDLGIRCYTYASTLRYALEAAAETGTAVIVTDRPGPFADMVDGPVLDPAFESFVGAIPSPLVYGMTQGETALWLKKTLGLDLDLHVEKAGGFSREACARASSNPWIPPSPGIRSLESALCYPLTVWGEALPSLDGWRSGLLPFQVLGAPWIEAEDLCRALAETPIGGVTFHPHPYRAIGKPFDGQVLQGVRAVVREPGAYRPVEAAVWLLFTLQSLYGLDTVWDCPGARPEWFDKLMGTDSAREALQARTPPARIIGGWQPAGEAFRDARKSCLLY